MGKRYERTRASRDAYRRRLRAKGYTSHQVFARKLGFTGSSGLFGDAGTPNPATDELVELIPPPLLFPVDQKAIDSGNGRVKAGDLRFMQILQDHRQYFSDPNYEIIVRGAGSPHKGIWGSIDGEILEETPYSLAMTLRFKRNE